MFPSPGAERLLVGLRGDREPVEKAAPGQLEESVTQITTDCDKSELCNRTRFRVATGT